MPEPTPIQNPKVIATDDADRPLVEIPKTAPNLNKTGAAAGGTVGGGVAGALLLWLLHARYGIDPGPEESAIIGSAFSFAVGTAATFFVPLLTAAQQLALRKLEQQ